jgi:glutamate racemase
MAPRPSARKSKSFEAVPMNARPVVFFDSGIGGLPYYRHFRQEEPDYPALYLADRAHFPYGPHSKEELCRIVIALIGAVRERFNPCAVAIVCNTASVAALTALRDAYPELPFIGTVPAVKPAILAHPRGKIGVLGTERTVHDTYIRQLAQDISHNCQLETLAAPRLVEFVEKESLDATDEQTRAAVQPPVDYFAARHCDALVLGCTHFLHLSDEFHHACDKRACGTQIAVYDSLEGVTHRVIEMLHPQSDTGKRTPVSVEQTVAARLVAPNSPVTEEPRTGAWHRLYLTGGQPIEPRWYGWGARYGLTPELLGEAL